MAWAPDEGVRCSQLEPGRHELVVVGTFIAAIGAVLALTLVRRRDFAAAPAPAQG
jgi:hypothetical protein